MSDRHKSDLLKKLSQAQRRQLLQAWLTACPLFLAAAMLLAGAWYVAQPWLPLTQHVYWYGLLAIAGIAGMVATTLYVVLRRPTSIDAALALDGAFSLRERVTTALMLTVEQKQSPAGVALLEDVRQKVVGLDVSSKFPFAMPRTSWLVPLVAMTFALLVVCYDPMQIVEAKATDEKATAAKKDEALITPPKVEDFKQAQQARRQRLKDLDSEKLAALQSDLDRLLEKVEGSDKPSDLNLAAQEASKLADEIKKKQDEAGRVKELINKLRNQSDLKNAKDGPGKETQKALSEGDLHKAKQELDKLLQSMKEGKLSEEDKKKLADQLADLASKLKELAEQTQRKEAIEKSTLDPETKKKELAKLEKQSQELQDLAQLAEKLSQCKQCLQNGRNQETEQNLQDAAKMIQEMINDAQEAEELAKALEDLEGLKRELGDRGEKQKGTGANEGDDEEGVSDLTEREDPEEKPGTNRRTRSGIRKDRGTETKNHNQRARSPHDEKGKIFYEGKGPDQPKPDRDSIGKTTVDIGPGLEETKRQATDALRGQRVPQAQKTVVGEFYQNLADPKREEKK